MADITIDQLATLTFYQIPEIFFTRIQYNENGYVKLTSSYTDLSSDAKLAYGALYNRCKLSISSFQKGNRDYVDENGAVFLIFTVSDLMLLLDKGKMKVTKIKKELQEHGFLSPQLVQKLSLFGKDAKILENKIYQSKRQVEKNYNNLLADQEIYGEVWLQDLERELDKLIFKIKTGEAEEKPIQNVPAYFYKMMIHFWKMALLIEKEHGFLEVSGQSEYARKFPDECPSLIAYYYPDKLSETKLNSYLSELSKGVETC